MLKIEDIRKDFPILEEKVYGKPLIYFDNAATTQKPRCVIDTIYTYYTKYNANIHRGVHYLSEKLTADYEAAREKVKNFIYANKYTYIYKLEVSFFTIPILYIYHNSFLSFLFIFMFSCFLP